MPRNRFQSCHPRLAFMMPYLLTTMVGGANMEKNHRGGVGKKKQQQQHQKTTHTFLNVMLNNPH